MKYGKKLLCLCLALVLCVSLAACASEEDKAFEAANALLEAGDYDGAIAAFTAIGRYQEISAKIDEATRLRDEANAGFLFGTWKDILTGNSFVFEPEGKAALTIVNPDGTGTTVSLTYSFADGEVTITSPEILSFFVTEVDGVTHLDCRNYEYDLVPAADYEALAPITVEITMDNWQEYFDFREAEDVQDNAFGEPEYRSLGYGVFLKEEYVARLVNDYDSVEAHFEMQYDECLYQINGDLVSGEYTLEAGNPWWYSAEELQQGCTVTTEVWNYHNSGVSEYSDLYETVSGFFYGGNWQIEEEATTYICLPTNGQIIRAEGTLTLRR